MKIKIWVEEEIEVDGELLVGAFEESCILFESDTESYEGMLTRLSLKGDVDLPDDWRIHEDFDFTVTRQELSEAIEEVEL